jgi:exodeoxyribonuclease-3
MRITTWNVNGLRALINKEKIDWIELSSADVICFQEIKVQPGQIDLMNIPFYNKYKVIWHSAKRPGYSGVITMYKNDPLEVRLGIGIEKYDTEGRVIEVCYPEFRLFNIYFPNGQRDLGRLTYKLDFYADLLAYCDQLHKQGEKIILCGDFNTAHKEIDLSNPKANEKYSGFLPEEREWIDHYIEHGFVDAYRQLYPEREQYTWWTYRFGARQRNIGWRLDYFLISASLMDRVKDITIFDQIQGSDHCPVTLEIDD